jgi:hypothetical protein
MVGGSPTMLPPGFVQMPMQQQPPAYAMTPPQPRPVAAASRPTIRFQSQDDQTQHMLPPRSRAIAESKPVALSMPSPEQLGISQGSRVETFDWAAARSRLDRLGAVFINLDKTNQGRFRFTCLLPTASPNRNHRVEAVAASEAEAVQLVIEKSEQWAGGH